MAQEEEPAAELIPVGGDDDAEMAKLVSRRAFLTGALAGGAVGLVVAAGTGLGVYQVVDARAQEALTAAESEIAKLQGLVELYEKIEKVGLDGILQTGMVAVAGPLELVQRGAEALKKGLDLIEGGVLALREALPSASEAFSWLRDRVTSLADGIERLQSAVDKLLDKVTDNPVAAKLAEALNWVVDRLPFQWGQKVRDAFDRLVDLISSSDEIVRDVNTRLLEPVEKRWFSSEEGAGLGTAFLDPLVQNVLDPLEAHLGKVAGLVDTWQAKLVAPGQRALEERESVRTEIAAYRAKNGLPR
jgi:hypothetical protein